MSRVSPLLILSSTCPYVQLYDSKLHICTPKPSAPCISLHGSLDSSSQKAFTNPRWFKCAVCCPSSSVSGHIGIYQNVLYSCSCSSPASKTSCSSNLPGCGGGGGGGKNQPIISFWSMAALKISPLICSPPYCNGGAAKRLDKTGGQRVKPVALMCPAFFCFRL